MFHVLKLSMLVEKNLNQCTAVMLMSDLVICMVFILDGCSFHYAHTWSNETFRFVEGIWLHRKNLQIRFFFGKRPCFHHSYATWNEQPSNIKAMVICRIRFFPDQIRNIDHIVMLYYHNSAWSSVFILVTCTKAKLPMSIAYGEVNT